MSFNGFISLQVSLEKYTADIISYFEYYMLMNSEPLEVVNLIFKEMSIEKAKQIVALVIEYCTYLEMN